MSVCPRPFGFLLFGVCARALRAVCARAIPDVPLAPGPHPEPAAVPHMWHLSEVRLQIVFSDVARCYESATTSRGASRNLMAALDSLPLVHVDGSPPRAMKCASSQVSVGVSWAFSWDGAHASSCLASTFCGPRCHFARSQARHQTATCV